MKSILTTICLLFTLITISQAQTIENLKAVFKDGMATITYDLVGIPGRVLYRVDLYGSHDNFSNKLIQVSGEVGTNLRVGKQKKIEWAVEKELGKTDESITFQIKADWVGTEAYLPIVFTNPTGGFERRGHGVILTWIGGKLGTEKVLTLYKGTQLVATIATTVNIRTHTWTFPKNLEKGDGYTFRLDSPGDSGVSNPFTIKAKTPLWVKLTPVIVLVAVIPFLGGSSTNDKESLPDSPNPN